MLICLRRLYNKYSQHDQNQLSSEDQLLQRQDQLELLVLILNTMVSCLENTQMLQLKFKVSAQYNFQNFLTSSSSQH